ncbi:MAG TPA: FHA domain-containing protein, partial [Kofleriaceae bacterium]|nr:FHA domain-containing protein [Kofleriaceae bacterium]
RNHAKVTRDPETGRYTISDLQSSNGVRVNGQDYGKVELRRGDTVDLGHVRLRFVEPGEDFVFNSSMVADIPETGSKRGLLVAIILGVLVLGGVGAFFFLNKKDTTQTAGGQKTDLGSQKGSGDVVADNGNGGGSEIAVNPVTTDGSGSETNTMVKPPPDDVAGNLALECKGYQAEAKWTDLSRCGEKLAKLDATEGKKFGATAASEIKAEGTLADLRKEKDFAKAKRQSDAISKDSYYRKDADARIEELKAHDVGQAVSKAEAMKSKGQCDQIARLANDIKDKYGPEWGQRVAEQKQGCVESTGGNTGTTTVVQKDCSTRLVDNSKSCKTQFCKANPNDSNCATGQTTVTAPANCDAEALKDKGMENVNMGQHAAALAQFEASLRCKKDDYVLALAFMAACNAQNAAKAKSYYGKLNPSAQTKYKVMCIRNHIDPAVP